MDTGNQARQRSQPRLRMCVFRSGSVRVLCRFWLLAVMYHGAVWATFLSDKQPQSLPSLSAPNQRALPAFSLPFSNTVPSNERHPMLSALQIAQRYCQGLVSWIHSAVQRFFSPSLYPTTRLVLHTSQSRLESVKCHKKDRGISIFTRHVMGLHSRQHSVCHCFVIKRSLCTQKANMSLCLKWLNNYDVS